MAKFQACFSLPLTLTHTVTQITPRRWGHWVIPRNLETGQFELGSSRTYGIGTGLLEKGQAAALSPWSPDSVC